MKIPLMKSERAVIADDHQHYQIHDAIHLVHPPTEEMLSEENISSIMDHHQNFQIANSVEMNVSNLNFHQDSQIIQDGSAFSMSQIPNGCYFILAFLF